MALLEGPGARALSNYWSDCQRLRAPATTAKDFEAYRDTILPLRLKPGTSPRLTNRFLALADLGKVAAVG